MGDENAIVGADHFKTDLLLDHCLLEIGLLLPETGLRDTGIRLKLVKEGLSEVNRCPEIAEGIRIVQRGNLKILRSKSGLFEKGSKYKNGIVPPCKGFAELQKWEPTRTGFSELSISYFAA
jgi:hypothetical protein